MNFPAVVTPKSVALFWLLALTVFQCALCRRHWRRRVCRFKDGRVLKPGEPLYYPAMILHTIFCLVLIRGLVWVASSDTFPPGSEAAGEGEIPEPAN